MRAFSLMMVAVVLTLLIAPIAWVMQHIRYPLIGRPLPMLYWDTAIGLDQLGGAILYGEPDWTISSRTYWLANRGNRWARGFEQFINLFFGAGHCQKSYQNEFEKKEA